MLTKNPELWGELQRRAGKQGERGYVPPPGPPDAAADPATYDRQVVFAPILPFARELDYDQRAGIRELGVLGKRCLARPGLIAGKYDYLGHDSHATLGKMVGIGSGMAALQAQVYVPYPIHGPFQSMDFL
eukprot:XP_001693452.1 predicted protein [Chlamydomonas reinhardtii]